MIVITSEAERESFRQQIADHIRIVRESMMVDYITPDTAARYTVKLNAWSAELDRKQIVEVNA